MLSPQNLQKGDKVIIIAPAKKVSPHEIEMAVKILQDWGLEVILGKYLFNTFNQFAGTDEERTEDLQNALDRTDIKAIMCARGGYGTIRVVDKLKFDKFLENPKWLVGFSDITVLHCHLYNLGVESMHAVMPLLFPKQTEQTIESLRKALFGEKITIEAFPNPLNKLGNAKGQLIGGNLSLFANTIGTISEIDTKGKILFLEDVNEYIYHLDRMMIHLYRAGKLKDLAGLIVGQFTEVQDNEVSFGKDINQIIQELTTEYHYPIAFDFPIGHEIHNMTIVCGKEGYLEVNEKELQLNF